MQAPHTPLAFVLMPFDSDFDGVYEDLIVSPLTEVGFEVRRADSLLNQRNILQDVVSGIAEADLIVADVTGLNPNVMYELGLAHGLGKRTVMISQRLEELPFDLRPYRATAYSVNFREAERLADVLRTVGRAVLDGSAEFSNPVQDFAPSALSTGAQVGEFPRQRESHADEPDAEDDPSDLGLLEALDLMQTATTRMTDVTERLGAATKTIGERFNAQGARLNQIQKNLGKDKALQPSLAVMRDTARDLDSYSEEIEGLNGELSESLDDVIRGAGVVARLRSAETAEDQARIREEIASFDHAETALTESYFSTAQFAEVVGSFPSMESHLTRASRRAAKGVSETAAIIERAQSEFGRVKALLQERLISVG